MWSRRTSRRSSRADVAAGAAEVTDVRALETADEADWRRLWAAYCAFYRTDLPDSVIAATWTRLHDPAVPLFGHVAVRDGNVVGLAHVLIHPNTWSTADDAYLEDLYVDEPARGAGVGRAIIEHLIGLGRAAGWRRLTWHTQTGNRAARAFYEAFCPANGWVRYVVEPGA